MKRVLRCFFACALLLFLNGHIQLQAQWVTDTIAESLYEDRLAKVSLDIDANNQLYAIYVKKIPGGMIGIPQFQLWYSEKLSENDWSAPVMISAEDESTLFQSIAVTPDGEVFIAYESDFDGMILKKRTEEGWETVDLNLPGLSGSMESPVVTSGPNGKIHLVFTHQYYDEEIEQFVIEMVYSQNLNGDWETTVIPDSEHFSDTQKHLSVAEDGSIHLVSINTIVPSNCTFYITNRTEDESGWEKLVLEDSLEMKNILGISCFGTEVHLSFEGKASFFDPMEIYYLKIQDGTAGEPLLVNPGVDAQGQSFTLSPNGQAVLAYIEMLEMQNGNLYLCVQEEEGFNASQLIEDSGYPKDAFLRHDINGDLQVMISKGQWEPNIYLMHPNTGPQYFSVEFSIVNEGGESVSDAIVTLDGQTHEPGNYVFTELVSGTYSYSIARQGYHNFEGEVTIADQDLTVPVELATDYTGFETLPVHSLKVYPNPAMDQVQVEAGREILSVSVYDITGRQIYRQEPQTRKTMLSVSGMPVGIYILNVETAEGTLIRKLSVKP